MDKVSFMTELVKSKLGDKEIRDKALAVRMSAYKYADGALDVMALAEQHGFSVHPCKTKKNIQSFIVVDLDEDLEGAPIPGTHKFIGYNVSLPVERRRRGIAHELGHYFLHDGGGEIRSYQAACPDHGTE
ncbi:MAG: ImmA/IrrE family metallo-endopeptidase, partial [Oscillospiraceae bacterium]|nr:ImmA/IrrE family metallo-endopeptidase [Oscillospiraceae bacterium]